MAEKSIRNNFIYNLAYQLTLLLSPLVVTPYVSRVLGPEGSGFYSYSNSIVSYFVLVAVLGTATFGQRAVSYEQKDPEARSRVFWEVFIVRCSSSLITIAAYVGYVLLAVSADQKLVCLIMTLNIINVMFDISWFLQGMEEFGKIALCSIAFRLMSIASIFLFVKEASDLYLYVLFLIVFTVAGNAFLWAFLPKYLCRCKGIHPFRSIKSILQLFVPTIAVQVYTVLDKSMIGWFADGFAENGYYEGAEKIIKIAITAVTSLGTVMIPRISYTFKTGDTEKVKYYIYRSFRFVWMMAVPIMLGFVSIASVFVPVYFGAGYEKCAVLIPILSSIVISIGLSSVTGMQYLVPVGKQNILTLTVVTGALVNLLLNLILIPRLYSVGASIATVVAEISVAVFGFIYLKVKAGYSLMPIFTSSAKYWLAGAGMFAALWFVKRYLPVNALSLVGMIIGGAVLYFLLLFLLRDAFLLQICKRMIGSLRFHKTPPPRAD